MIRQSLSPDSVFTERILRAFPGSRLFWVLVWGGMALVQGLVASSLLPGASEREILAAEPEPIGMVINAYVIVLSLVIARQLVARTLSLRPVVDQVVGGGIDEDRLFRGVNSWIGPLVLAVAITAVEAASLFDVIDPAESLIVVPTLLIVHVPLATATWTVITVLASIDRLGRTGLDLDHRSAGSTLGLRPVGELAVTTFAFFAAGALPVLLANTDSGLALGINTTILLVAVIIFFLSMYRIHLQMSRARERALSEAKEWWADAYQLASDVSLEALERRAAIVTVADVLERRARDIKTWPLTGGLYGQLYGIIIGVMAGLLTRVVALSVGL